MRISSQKAALLGMFILIYGLLFYYLITLQLRIDFSSFYAAALAYIHDVNPYQCLVATFFPIPKKIPVNLNPPFFLQLISPLTQISFQSAATLWSLGSFLMGISGALISFKLTLPPAFFKKNWFYLMAIYLAMYSTLMNTSVSQMGGVLLFFIMAGYYFFLRKHDYLAGVFWGFIISIKLFPALLFLFVIHQKRFTVLFMMLLTCLLAFLFPLLSKGAENYELYFNLLPRILWYGDNWNASIYGFLFRLFIDVKADQNLWLIKILYLLISTLLVVWYVKKLNLFRTTLIDHRAFCFTLVMMLFLSPFGWLYYFSLLIMPLTLIYQSLTRKDSAIWALCLFLINVPIGYVQATDMGWFVYKISFYSLYFYGLVLVLILMSRLKEPPQFGEVINHQLLYPLKITLTFGLLVVLSNLIIHINPGFSG